MLPTEEAMRRMAGGFAAIDFRPFADAMRRLGISLGQLYPPTGPGLARLAVDFVPHVASAAVYDVNDDPGIRRGEIVVHLRLRWYAWMTLGVLHCLTRRRAQEWLQRFAVLGCTVVIRYCSPARTNSERLPRK